MTSFLPSVFPPDNIKDIILREPPNVRDNGAQGALGQLREPDVDGSVQLADVTRDEAHAESSYRLGDGVVREAPPPEEAGLCVAVLLAPRNIASALRPLL